MATNLNLDDRKLEELLKVSGAQSKREAVTRAIDEYLQRRKQVEIIKLFGTIDYESDYDITRERRRKR